MDKRAIFEIIKKNIIRVLPELKSFNITTEDSLIALGASSMDRAEIIVMIMEELHINMPKFKLGKAKNLAALLDILRDEMANAN